MDYDYYKKRVLPEYLKDYCEMHDFLKEMTADKRVKPSKVEELAKYAIKGNSVLAEKLKTVSMFRRMVNSFKNKNKIDVIPKHRNNHDEVLDALSNYDLKSMSMTDIYSIVQQMGFDISTTTMYNKIKKHNIQIAKKKYKQRAKTIRPKNIKYAKKRNKANKANKNKANKAFNLKTFAESTILLLKNIDCVLKTITEEDKITIKTWQGQVIIETLLNENASVRMTIMNTQNNKSHVTTNKFFVRLKDLLAIYKKIDKEII